MTSQTDPLDGRFFIGRILVIVRQMWRKVRAWSLFMVNCKKAGRQWWQMPWVQYSCPNHVHPHRNLFIQGSLGDAGRHQNSWWWHDLQVSPLAGRAGRARMSWCWLTAGWSLWHNAVAEGNSGRWAQAYKYTAINDLIEFNWKCSFCKWTK